LESGGKIVGIRTYFYFDQKDTRYTLDADTVLSMVWDVTKIRNGLRNLIRTEHYDYVLTLLPVRETHGHHKAAAILALETVSELQKGEKPIIFGMSVLRNADTVSYKSLQDYSITRDIPNCPPLFFDRTISFGYAKRLNYKIIVNWVIAEHKSQGAMQLGMNEGDREVFWYFAVNDTSRYAAAKAFFEEIGKKAHLP
jgi:N-acetylglucosamine malate deacetylase 2